MPDPRPATLNLARGVLRFLIGLNLAFGVGIFGLLVASFLLGSTFWEALGIPPADQHPRALFAARWIMIFGIAGVTLTHRVLTRLLAIIYTVRDGDPFVPDNAVRLQRIAWLVVGLELTHAAVGMMAAQVRSHGVKLDVTWNASFTPWLAVLLLFVLARVFDAGTRMREDLEGTV